MPLSSFRQFEAALAHAADATEQTMDRLLPKGRVDETRVYEAMRYSSLGGGKRLRAFFVLAGATLFRVGQTPALRTASAIEFVHAYSLIHDDLPAMDDDDLRRGKPSCHKQFDEATAILAGDCLHALAFEILADPSTHADPFVRSELILDLARASGPSGMAGGQQMDLEAERQVFDLATVTRLQQMKTGALICAAVEAGAILGRVPPEGRTHLRGYAHDLGLAFQIADDLLDLTAPDQQLGKPAGHDMVEGVYTLPVLRTLQAGGVAAVELLALLGKPLSAAEQEKALSIVRSNGGIAAAVAVAHEWVARAEAACDLLPVSAATEVLRVAPGALLSSVR